MNTEKKFPWGKVVDTHEIGEYRIIEYHPYVYVDGCGTRDLHEHTEFHPLLDGKGGYSYSTLDMALIGVIARKHGDTEAAGYFAKMIGMTP